MMTLAPERMPSSRPFGAMVPSAVVAGQPWHPEPVNVTVPVVLAVVVVVVAIAALIVRARYRR